jgi:predicted peroxiredoxin
MSDRRRIGTIGVAALVLGLAIGSLLVGAGARADRPSVIINLTSGTEDLHAVTMALQLAGHALTDGRETVIFCNVRAPELTGNGLADSAVFNDNPPIREMMRDLMDRGATVLACPHCMKAMGIEASELRDGIQVASRETLFGSMREGTVVFSY